MRIAGAVALRLASARGIRHGQRRTEGGEQQGGGDQSGSHIGSPVSRV